MTKLILIFIVVCFAQIPPSGPTDGEVVAPQLPETLEQHIEQAIQMHPEAKEKGLDEIEKHIVEEIKGALTGEQKKEFEEEYAKEGKNVYLKKWFGDGLYGTPELDEENEDQFMDDVFENFSMDEQLQVKLLANQKQIFYETVHEIKEELFQSKKEKPTDTAEPSDVPLNRVEPSDAPSKNKKNKEEKKPFVTIKGFFHIQPTRPMYFQGAYTQKKVNMTIYDPNNKPIYNKEANHAVINVKAELPGEYMIVFDNKVNDQVFNLMIILDTSQSRKEQHLQNQHLDPLDEVIEVLVHQISGYLQQTKYSNKRIVLLDEILGTTHNHTLIIGIAETILLVLLSLWQVYYIKRILDNKRII